MYSSPVDSLLWHPTLPVKNILLIRYGFLILVNGQNGTASAGAPSATANNDAAENEDSEDDKEDDEGGEGEAAGGGRL